MNKECELLSPAGSLEKLKIAFLYGADAVYIGGEEFSLRKAAENFTYDEIKEGVDFANKLGKKVYVTANIIPHNEDLIGFEEYISKLSGLGVHGVIISDLGLFGIAKEVAPDMEIHISVQANNTNFQSLKMWHKLGAKRVVLSRELSLKEIKEIKDNIPSDMELEAFVHGAMCISYSGRCLLSNYLTNRDANKGECSHPCRWKYYLMEEQRPGEYFPVFENERGTFIFNSKDLCMIEHVGELIEAGVKSFKIEGRVKSEYYVATITKAYRKAIDDYYDNKPFDSRLLEEIKKVSNRDYTKGFYFGKPDNKQQVYTSSSYLRDYDVIGFVTGYDYEKKELIFSQRNKCFVGDEIEIMPFKGDFVTMKIKNMKDENDNYIDSCPHAQMTVKIKSDICFENDTIIRKKRE